MPAAVAKLVQLLTNGLKFKGSNPAATGTSKNVCSNSTVDKSIDQ